MSITSIAVATDAPPLVLEHLTTAEGLPQATVMSTLQDSQGFIWLGTEDGLVRFDGSKLYRYAYSRNDPRSLPGNFIWQIVEDVHHDLWLAIKDGGVARWNRATDDFSTFRHDPRDPASLGSNSVRAIHVDRHGQVWIGTSDAGLDVLDPATGRAQHYRHDDALSASLNSNQVFTLAPAANDAVWIGTDAGLDRTDTDRRSFNRFGPARGRADSLAGKQISRILEDRSGAVWVASFDGGLTRMDRDGNVLMSYRHDDRRETSLRRDDVRALLEDQAGRLWVGTADGLDLLDRSSGEFTHFRRNDSDSDSLRDSFVMSLYEDQGGLIWIGTRTGGVSRWNPRSWEFGGHRPAWLGSGPVNSFAEAAENHVWIATLDAGLVQFDMDSGAIETVDEVLGRRNVLGAAHVMTLRRDHLGTLWIGTMAHGLKKLHPDGRLESIPVKAGDTHATSAAGIMTIVETRGGQIWIGTFGGGANILDPASGTVRQLPYESGLPDVISGSNVTSIAEDKQGNLWIGTDGDGLNLVRADGKVLRTFRHDAQDPQSLPADSIYAITVDEQGRTWLGTDGGGLVRVVQAADAPESIRFEAVTRAEGLSSDTLYGIAPDAAGNLWLSGNAGLMRFNPDTKAVKAYHREHGLQGEEFAFGAYFRLRDGRLCFGGPGGFNIFDPDRLTENRQPPRLSLMNVDVSGARMKGTRPFWLLDRIPLDYHGNIVSLDFGVLDFSSTRHNRVAYRLPGLTDDWIDLDGQRRLTLTNLPAGDHRLEVRAAGSDSGWSTKPLLITIHRDPAPWASGLAYTLYVLLALSLILYRFHRQRQKFHEMAQARIRLESEVQLRTRELVESNRQLAEAARAKSDFLDRMSHELRTPMNGVVGMTELLSRTALSATQSHLTRTIKSSAQILLQIVNDLLDLSKIRAGKVKLEALPIDLGQVLEECTSLFAGAAESKRIELIVCPPARSEHVLLGDPLRMRQILMNLVGNAVKFTSQGEVAVRADVVIEGEVATASIAVTDTGIGMDEAAIKRIFEPFSQADETTTRRFGGTGLGLAICRELSDVMGGKIAVESRPQVGSTFRLSLPLQVGQAIATADTLQLPPRRIRILTRRPSLQESLSRHIALLGLDSVAGDELASAAATDRDVLVIDASTHLDELKSLLVRPHSTWPPLIVIATPAEVEAMDLRVVLDEKRIVLKPVHRIAFREALASASGVQMESVPLANKLTSFAGHVLLVEDEPVNAAVAEGYLATLGCTSVWVASGTEAVARSSAERFDLIFMDLNMPDMDGFTATRLIRQGQGAGRRVPIVALTAHDAANFRLKCLQADMDDILSKPYSLEDCAHVLRQWLANDREALAVAARADAPAAAEESLTVIDAATVASLRKLRAGQHSDLYAKLVDLFRSGSTDSLAQLRDAIASNDFPAAAAVCHKLASSAANVGAVVYGKQVRRLEQLCLAGDAATARASNDHIQAAHASLIESLHAQTLRASA